MKKIALVGGGPAALFMYKKLVALGYPGLEISIFEKNAQLGAGMPYSEAGARIEHVTNVSGNEIPDLVIPVKEWITTTSSGVLDRFALQAGQFNENKVLPRLLFGSYLADQFTLLQEAAAAAGISTINHLNTFVNDIVDEPASGKVKIYTESESTYLFDTVVICTGHQWPRDKEATFPNWFDSPYPPAKIAQKFNYPVAIRGAALTAIDAVRTLARSNGSFSETEDGNLTYQLAEGSTNFRLVLHSLNGLLPAIRFHVENLQPSTGNLISEEEAFKLMKLHKGFIPLDLIYERNFLQPLKEQDAEFYEKVRELSLEQFVEYMMTFRQNMEAFQLFKAEYKEAAKSIRRQEAIAWKERLAALSYAMNYPAKHLSAEDMTRLKKVLMPLISIVIAFVPQSSCRELMALHDAGILTLIAVDRESEVKPVKEGGAVYTYKDESGLKVETRYQMFVEAIGQPHFPYEDFPFNGLKEQGTVTEAWLYFKENENAVAELNNGNTLVMQDREGNYYLKVPGININDNFQVLDKYGMFNQRIYMMAVPHIGGLNPDYSGLDFCDTASERIVKHMSQTMG